MTNEKNTMTRNEKFSQLVDGAVFAQLQIQHNGSRYDRTIELFRCDRNGNKMTDFIIDFDIDGITKIGTTIYAEMALEEGIGDLEDLVVELIFDGGYKTNFVIDVKNNYIGDLREDWDRYGDVLNINEIIA